MVKCCQVHRYMLNTYCHFLLFHHVFRKNIELIGRQYKVTIRDVIIKTLRRDKTWRIVTDIYSETPRRNYESFNGTMYASILLSHNPEENITASEKIIVEPHSEGREIITRLILEIPEVLITLK